MPLAPTNSTTPYSTQVIFFTGQNFTGDAYSSDMYDQIDLLATNPSLDNKFISVKLGSQCQLLTSRDYSFIGPYQLFTSDSDNLNIGGLSSWFVVDKNLMQGTCSESTDDSFTFEGTTRCGRRVRVSLPPC